MQGVLLPVLYIAFFISLIYKLKFFSFGISPKWIIAVFILKIISGTVLWFIYTRFYADRLTADIFKYFDDGRIMYDALFSKPMDYFKMLFGISDPSLEHYYINDMRHWNREFGMGLYNENRTLIRFNAFVDLFSFGNYHVHTIFICFLSLTGLVGIYRAFISFVADKKKELFVLIFLVPSVLFWGSGVLKEALVLFSLGMSLYYFFKLIHDFFSLPRFIFFLFFLFLLSISKMYVLFAIIPSFISYFIISKTNFSFSFLKFVSVLLICLITILLIPKYDFLYMIRDKQAQAIYMARGGSYLGSVGKERRIVYISPEIKNRIIKLDDKPGYCKIVSGAPFVSWNLDNTLDTLHVKSSSDTSTYWIYNDGPAAGSLIDIPFLKPGMIRFLAYVPRAFINAAFRPHLMDGKNPLIFLSALENFLIAIFIFICIIFSNGKKIKWHLVLFCFVFALLLFILIGLTSPVLGAVVRYKIPALPFFLISFLLMLDKEKLLHKLPFLRRPLT